MTSNVSYDMTRGNISDIMEYNTLRNLYLSIVKNITTNDSASDVRGSFERWKVLILQNLIETRITELIVFCLSVSLIALTMQERIQNNLT